MNARTRITLFLSAMLLATPLVACGSSSSGSSEGEAEQQTEQQTGMANPFVDCISASEAAEMAGFQVTFPESVPGYSERLYQAVEGEMVQCIYSAGDSKVLIRKAKGTEDISGDYNEYSSVTEVDVNGIKVTEKGDGSLVHVATWTKDEFTYAIDADDGLDASVIQGLVGSTM